MTNLGHSSTTIFAPADTATDGKRENRFRFRFLALTTVLVSLAVPSLHAQVETGTITGVVRDKSGAVVSNTQVTIRNAATGLASNAVTDSQGIYVSPPLSPGDYNVEFQAAGFGKLLEHVRLEVGQRVAADATVSVGQASQTVTVEATAQLLESETSTVSNLRTEEAAAEWAQFRRVAGFRRGRRSSTNADRQCSLHPAARAVVLCL